MELVVVNSLIQCNCWLVNESRTRLMWDAPIRFRCAHIFLGKCLAPVTAGKGSQHLQTTLSYSENLPSYMVTCLLQNLGWELR